MLILCEKHITVTIDNFLNLLEYYRNNETYHIREKLLKFTIDNYLLINKQTSDNQFLLSKNQEKV